MQMLTIISVQTSALRIGFSSFSASVMISASTKTARPVCSTHVFNVCAALCRTLGCKHRISHTHGQWRNAFTHNTQFCKTNELLSLLLFVVSVGCCPSSNTGTTKVPKNTRWLREPEIPRLNVQHTLAVTQITASLSQTLLTAYQLFKKSLSKHGSSMVDLYDTYIQYAYIPLVTGGSVA